VNQMAKENDTNDADDKDLDDKSKDKDSDAGDGKEKSDDGDGQEKLTKTDIQTMVTDAITAAVKDVITPEIDRRISGAAKTIYKKAGIKEDSDDSNKGNDADAESAAARLKDRQEMVAVYAESTIKEDLGKLTEDQQNLIDTLIGVEIGKTPIEEGQTVKDHGKIIGTSVLKIYKKHNEAIVNQTKDALKKSGQLIEVGEPGRTQQKGSDFDQGQKIAEKRHPKKKE